MAFIIILTYRLGFGRLVHVLLVGFSRIATKSNLRLDVAQMH